jgi:hypothetical protein
MGFLMDAVPIMRTSSWEDWTWTFCEPSCANATGAIPKMMNVTALQNLLCMFSSL